MSRTSWQRVTQKYQLMTELSSFFFGKEKRKNFDKKVTRISINVQNSSNALDFIDIFPLC